jgi:hypothetical protein
MRNLVVVVFGLAGLGVARADDAAKPTLTFGTPTVAAGLDAKAVETVVKRSEAKLFACYKHELERDPGLGGIANVHFTVDANGKVGAIETTGIDESGNACFSAAIKTLVFAKPKTGKVVEVIYPIAFSSGLASGFDDTNIYGGLVGDEVGTRSGSGGGAAGGGGAGWGTLGPGRYGTIGHGSGTSSGYGVAHGGMRGRAAAVPTVSLGQPVAQGDLDKAIIRRYVKRNLQKIQYCYEKQLLAKKGLSGTVQAQFTIAGNGHVTASAASGVDKDVSSCIADVIAAIEFPKPKDGKDVPVSYPITLHPADAPATK